MSERAGRFGSVIKYTKSGFYDKCEFTFSTGSLDDQHEYLSLQYVRFGSLLLSGSVLRHPGSNPIDYFTHLFLNGGDIKNGDVKGRTTILHWKCRFTDGIEHKDLNDKEKPILQGPNPTYSGARRFNSLYSPLLIMPIDYTNVY